MQDQTDRSQTTIRVPKGPSHWCGQREAILRRRVLGQKRGRGFSPLREQLLYNNPYHEREAILRFAFEGCDD